MNLLTILAAKKSEEHQRRRSQGRHRYKGAMADEIERREQAEGERGSKPADQGMVFADGSGQHHADQVRRQHRFAVGPGGQGSHAEQEKQKEFGFQFGGAIAGSRWKEPRRQPEDQGFKTTRHATTTLTSVCSVKGAKTNPRKMTVPRSLMKQAARMALPKSVLFKPSSSITA